ncbi:head-tail connector protein [Sulfurimonas sp. HSL1-6]|uniref:head-tail connector protein n=1 Tax=Thiomicrolovo immobilis TaxID=3131935 RepID=UPI0031FA4887
MTMNLVLKTSPSGQVVSTAEAKAHLNVLHGDDDAYIDTLIAVATEQAEEITGRQFLTATYELYMDDLPLSFELPKPPMASVTSVEYIPDGEAVFSTLDAALYLVGKGDVTEIVRHPDATYPDVENIIDGVRVTFVCGYGASADVPAPIKHWIKKRVATMYEMREEQTVGVKAEIAESEYDRYLLSKYKVRWL